MQDPAGRENQAAQHSAASCLAESTGGTSPAARLLRHAISRGRASLAGGHVPGSVIGGCTVSAVHAARVRSYTVMIACHSAASRELTCAQAEGRACIRCGMTGGELIPVGVIVPPGHDGGIARACQLCAAIVLAP